MGLLRSRRCFVRRQYCFFETGTKTCGGDRKVGSAKHGFPSQGANIIQTENLGMQKWYQTAVNRKTKLNHIEAETERIGSEVG